MGSESEERVLKALKFKADEQWLYNLGVYRWRILDKVSGIVRFTVKEEEISPEHRVKITSLAEKEKDRETLHNMAQKASTTSSNCAQIAVAFFFVGILLLWAPSGITQLPMEITTICSVLGFLVIVGSFALGAAGYQKHREARELSERSSTIRKEIDQEVVGLAESIKQYILKVSKARTSPPIHIDFGQVLAQLRGKGVILQAIECPNCKGKIEISEVPKHEEILDCRYCGKRILAVNIFDKFKEIIGL